MEVNNIGGPDLVQPTFTPEQVVRHQEQVPVNNSDTESEPVERSNRTEETRGTVIDTYA